MSKVLDYSQYNYLICFGADENNSTIITVSSNRAIHIHTTEMLYVHSFAKTSFEYSTFLECFELLSKEKKESLPENENATLESVRDIFKRVKKSLLEDGIPLETAQILFVMPLGWTEEHYKDKLRGFFLDIGWITSKDNAGKLVMIPFIQVLTEYLQNPLKKRRHFDRERTSVLFFIQQMDRENRIEFSYTFFKMQSAKELITVSKTLASSNFLLVPSIKETKSIHLTTLEDVMYIAVKKIMASMQGNNSKCVSDETTTVKENDLAWKIACSIPHIQESLLGYGHWTLQYYFRQLNFKDQFQDLGKWTCVQLMAAIYEDVNIKHYFKQVSDFFKEALDEYGAVRDTPNGIQHILLYYGRLYRDFSKGREPAYCFHRTLVEESIIQPNNQFLRYFQAYDTRLAMQQSYKMIQIANAVLPPVIVGNEEQDDCSRPQTSKPLNNLIAPNSFYVQANVTETQISFILNKVIEVPSSQTGIDLFTAQERTIKIEDMVESASYILWKHYQSMLDIEEQQHALFKRCQDHDTMVLLSNQYKEFKKNAEKLIDSWVGFAAEDTFPKERLDTYHLVSVDQQCSCALRLSQRLLLEVGLKPAIANIATTITSALFSDDFFGLYQLSALILEKNFVTIKNLSFLCAINGLLKQALKGFLQIHHSRLLLVFQEDKCANSNISQYLGRGGYSQVSNVSYMFKFTIVFKEGAEATFGLLEGDTCKRLPSIPVDLELGPGYQSSELMYPGLNKEEDLPLHGVNLTFLTKDCRSLVIDVYVSDDIKGGTSKHQVGAMSLSAGFGSKSSLRSSVSVKILPVHNSLTLKFLASGSMVSSRLQDTRRKNDQLILQGVEEYKVYEVEESISVHERLFLKKRHIM